MRIKLFVIKLVFLILFFVHFNFTYGQQTNHDVNHVVAKGDNIYRISLRYNVPADSIVRWNNLDRNYTILIGQQLFISDRKSSAAETKRSPNNILAQIPGISGSVDTLLTDSLNSARQNKFLPFYSESVKGKSRSSFFGTIQYYYQRSHVLFKIILLLNAVFIFSVILLLITILFRRLMDGFDEVKRRECQNRYRDYIAGWLYEEHTGNFPEPLKKELKEKVYRDFFTSELLSLHANLTGESAEKLIGLFHFAGLKKYSVLKAHQSSWHLKAKGFRELAQMKIKEENTLISTHLNSKNPMLQIEAQLAWIQLNPDDPLSFLDDPDIRLTEWALLNSLHSLKKIDKTPDFGRWLQSPSKSVTLFAIKMTGIFKQFDNVELVTQRLHDTDPEIRLEAIIALGKMGVPFPGPELKLLFPGEGLINKSEIVRSLMMLSDSQNIPFFEAVLRDETELNLRILAARGFVSFNGIGKERVDLLYEAADPVLKKIIIHAKDNRI